MPKISLRGNTMPESPIRKLAPYAVDAKERGIKIFHLNIGQPDIETPKIAIDAIKNTSIKVLAYSPSNGFASYRKKLSEYYRKHKMPVTEDHIMVTTGGSEALLFTFMSCLNPGDEIIVPEPFYANYNGFAEIAGVKIIPITASIKDNFALPPIKEFEKKITERTRAILICNPNNPTGYLYKLKELKLLRDMVLKHDLYLFADEVYREFCYDGEEHHSILELDGLENNAVVADSVSKRYSMCGARIGCIITKNEALLATALKFGQARLSPPSIAQIAAEAALDTPQSYYDNVVNEYHERRDVLIKGLQQMEGVICPMPDGAFYATVQLPIDDCERFCQWLLEEFEYNGKTVMLTPATGFYATKILGQKQVRIAYVLKKEDLEMALECLDKALKVYPGRTIEEGNKKTAETSN